MSEQEKDKVLDLLYDKFVYGLDDKESKELVALGYELDEADSIERTVAALSLVELDATSELPSDLYSRVLSQGHAIADEIREGLAVEVQPAREIVLSGGEGNSWFGWLGWAAAAAASIALAVSLFLPRDTVQRAAGPPVASPTPEVRIEPERQRQALMETAGQVVTAQWGKGNVAELASVSGDVVWSDEKQEGYMRIRGLPVNDKNREQYQLWIFEDAKLEEHPKDGGVFDVNSDGEVIIPINAKLITRDPKAFAITVEKPGGVVVSKREKIAGLAAVKPKDA